MDVTAYQLQMRRFAEALKPMYRFFKKEGREPEMLTQYVLLCGAICQELANIEHRLLEVATVKKYGEEAAAQACKDIEAAEREQRSTEEGRTLTQEPMAQGGTDESV